ncbi:MAG: DUF6798 domain-containing protein [Planctomycetaceae bacterium]
MTTPSPSSSTAGIGSSARCWLIVSTVFIAVSLLSVPIPGINEPHYLSKARSFANPQWCQRDFFLQSGDAHAVFFAVVGPFAERLPFQWVLPGGRILCLLLLGWGWTRLARELQLTSAGAVAAACGFCLVAMTGNFSGEWVVGGFESKVPAYGCALAAVAFWLQAWRTQRTHTYAFAGGMAGLAVSWHPVVGLWFCIGIAMTEVGLLLVSSRPGASDAAAGRSTVMQMLRQSLMFSTVALMTSLPGLIPAVRLLIASDLPRELQDRANFIQVFWRLAHHLDPSTFSTANWVHTAVLSTVCLVALLRVRHLHHVHDLNHVTPLEGPTAWRPMVGLLCVAALTAGVGIAIGWHSEPLQELTGWQWRARLLKFYPFRFFDALLPMTTALALSWLIMQRIAVGWHTTFAALILAVTLLAAAQQRPASVIGYAPQTEAAWEDACRWLKTNTPADSLIASPRESFGLKLFAERAEYVCFKDCPQDAAGIIEWDRRLWRLHDWSKAAWNDGIFGIADLRDLKQQTGITHIVTRRLGPFESAPVWENSVWRIYETNPKQPARREGQERVQNLADRDRRAGTDRGCRWRCLASLCNELVSVVSATLTCLRVQPIAVIGSTGRSLPCSFGTAEHGGGITWKVMCSRFRFRRQTRRSAIRVACGDTDHQVTCQNGSL